MKITKDTTLAEIMEKPEAQEILKKYNFPCLSCPFAQSEIQGLKLGEVCKMYNLDTEGLLKELNIVYNKKD